MTAWYVDHGCTLYPTAYMAAPSSAASLPQEGDGLASGTGATPAVASASMDFTSATAAAGATIAIMGAALTCVASGASTTQFNAGSGATLAANLATAINAATALPTTTTGGIAPYLKAVVWATSSGAVLTVYSRIASAGLNQSSNASNTITCGTLANWTSAPANSNFSGGVSGPWSMFFNPTALAAAVNASVSGAGSYGAFVGAVMGLPVGGDVINVRTARASADIVIPLASAATLTVTGRTAGSATAYLQYKFDYGVVWSDGASSGVFTLQKSAGNFAAIINFRGYTKFTGVCRNGLTVQNGGNSNALVQYSYTDSAGYTVTINAPSVYGTTHCIFENIETSDPGSGSYTGSELIFTNGNFGPADYSKPTVFRGCKFGHMARSASSLFGVNGNFGLAVEASDCLMAYGAATQYTAAILTSVTAGVAHAVKLVRPKFTGGGGGHHKLLVLTAASMTLPVQLIVEDPVDMGQFIASDSAASVCGQVAGAPSASINNGELPGILQTISSSTGLREFLIDTSRQLLEWRNAGFPTSGLSLLPDGTPYSVRFNVAPTGVGAGLVTADTPQRAMRQVITNSLGAGNRVLTLRLLLDASYGGSSYTPSGTEWWIEGQYTSSTGGAVVLFSTQGTAPATDTQAWSGLTFAPFAGASRSYSRWKIPVTLIGVAAGSDIVLRLVCAKQGSAMNEWCFIDPQPVLA